jgi:hypothetical protein
MSTAELLSESISSLKAEIERRGEEAPRRLLHRLEELEEMQTLLNIMEAAQ